MIEVRVDRLDEMERVLVEVSERPNVKGDEAPGLVELAQLAHHANNLALPVTKG
tara:strand:- start:84 stop:245 length:162 start_codon:yes stop_codon:yes gene_type:complete